MEQEQLAIPEMQHPSATSMPELSTIVPLNDEHCFVCKERGDLFGCDNCHRAFHYQKPGCLPVRYLESVGDDGEWVCPCCDLNRVCPICSRDVETKDQGRRINCALCYRSIHPDCIDLPEELRRSDKLFAGQTLVNCLTCVRTASIKQLIDNKTVGDRMYSLAIPQLTANCHPGWLQSQIAQEIWDKQAYKPDPIDLRILALTYRISKIIDVKPPKKYKKFDKEFIVETLSNKKLERKYGAPDNFRFLVKWVMIPSSEATWEDEAAIVEEKEALSKYLMRLRTEIALDPDVRQWQGPTPRSVAPAFVEGDMFYVVSDGQRNSRINVERRKEVIAMTDSQFSKSPNPDNPFHHSEAIILTDPSNLKQWEIEIQANGSNIRLTMLEGSQQNCEEIIQRELAFKKHKLPSFNVLLTTPQLLSRHIDRIEATVEMNCLLVVLDLVDVPNSFFIHKFKLLEKTVVGLFKYDVQDNAKIRDMLGPRFRAFGQQTTAAQKRNSRHESPASAARETKDNRATTASRTDEPYFRGSVSSKASEMAPQTRLNTIMALPQPERAQLHFMPKIPPNGQGNQQPNQQTSSAPRIRIKPKEYSPPSESSNSLKKPPAEQSRNQSQHKEAQAKSMQANLKASYQIFMRDPVSFVSRCGLPELQRACLLHYLIAFGLNRGNHQQIYEHLTRWNRDVFGCGSNDLGSLAHRQQKRTIIKYLEVLLSIIYEDEDTSPTSLILLPLFFEFNHKSLCKHFIELSNLKQMYEEYRHKPESWPHNKAFALYRNKRSELVTAASWSAEDDLELIRLTLEHGFGSWSNIAEGFMPGRMDFRGVEYLIKRLRPTFKPLPAMSSLSFCARMINNRMSDILCRLWASRRSTSSCA